MLKIKRILSKKGFTLVELMVALAILGIAALGIFQAFSVGFQSMADAKYRTVATNIAQEKLEEIKNSVEILYPYYSVNTQEVNDKTYTVIVATNSKADNLEQVYVTVSWHDRQGNEKNVQLETLVYDLQVDYAVTPPDVDQIHLSADPMELTCCVVGETSTITAELFNLAGDRVPSGTPVRFNVTNGSVDPEFTVTDTNGRATTQLTLNGKNTATVTASSGTISSDEPYPHGDGAALPIACKPKANKIVLSASPSAIIPDTPEKRSFSTITATVTDACGDVVSGISNQVYVTFITDKGSFDNSIPVLTDNGIATVHLYMNESGEVAIIKGTITVDEVDITASTTVICTDYSISVTADPPSINPGGDYNTSTITATLIQSGGSPDVDAKPIIFTTDKGIFDENGTKTVTFETVGGVAVVHLSSLSGGDVATVTARYTFDSITISNTTTVQCTEYIISIIANPEKVIPDSPSTITATLTNYEGNPASNRRVDFYTTEGSLSDTSVYTNSSGIATTTLILDIVGETANVSATFGFASDSVNVTCINFILKVSANPESISPGESSEITALLTNYSKDPQSDQTITFTTDHGTFEESSTNIATADTNGIGEAVVHLILNTVGTAIVTAKYDVVEDTVTVECSETYIILNNPSNITTYNNNTYVRFDLYLHGGPLTVDKVKINWETNWSGNPTRYYRIWIRQPISGGNDIRIYNQNWPYHNNKNTIETLNEHSPYTISANSSFRIIIYFSSSIYDRDIVFNLNPDDLHVENYQVEFNTND